MCKDQNRRSFDTSDACRTARTYSFQVAVISLIFGIFLLVVSQLNLRGVFDIFPVVFGSVIGVLGIVLAAVGLIVLGLSDRQ